MSSSHLEVASWSSDQTVGDAALAFLRDVILFSEPLDSATTGPEPDLMQADYDDLAFAEYRRDFGPWIDDDE